MQADKGQRRVEAGRSGCAGWRAPLACLQVSHGVPIVLQEDDGVGGRQVEAQPAHRGGQQHDVDGGVGVEALHPAGEKGGGRAGR